MSVHSKDMPGGFGQDPYVTGNRPDFYLGTLPRKFNPTYSKDPVDLLHNAGQNGGAISLFSSMMFGGSSFGSLSRDDWNKEVLSAALQYFMQERTNEYNEGLRDEQRIYDNPLNQLSRLTGAGIGRDAAIELLSGGSGSGSGAAAPFADAPSSTAGLAPSESQVNGTSAIGNAVGSAIGLVNCGIAASQAYHQSQLLKSQAEMSQQQLNAQYLAGDAYQLLSQEVRRGVISDNDGHLYDSVDSITAGLEELAKLGDKTAQDWHGSGKIDQMRSLAPYISPLLSQFYKNERAGSDHDIWFADEHAKSVWSARVSQMTVDSLASGIVKNLQEIQNLVTDENWRRKTIDLIQGQLDLWDAEEENAKASAKYQRALARKTQLENIQTSSWMNGSVSVPIQTSVGLGDIEQTGLELFTTERLQNLLSGAMTSLQLNKGDYWKKQVNHMFNDVDNLITLSLLDGLKSKTSLETYRNMSQDSKDLMGLCDAYRSAGVFDYINTLGTNTRVSIFGNSMPMVDYRRITDPLDPKKQIKLYKW